MLTHTLLQLAGRVGSGVHFALSAALGCRENLCPAAYQKLEQGLVLSSCQWPVSRREMSKSQGQPLPPIPSCKSQAHTYTQTHILKYSPHTVIYTLPYSYTQIHLHMHHTLTYTLTRSNILMHIHTFTSTHTPLQTLIYAQTMFGGILCVCVCLNHTQSYFRLACDSTLNDHS